VETFYESTGILCYSDNPYKLVAKIDPDIVDFYRSLIPKSISLNKQAYDPHISIVRKEIPINLQFWGKYEGQAVLFRYSNIVRHGTIYYWLDVYSDKLVRIRLELGLEETTALSRPPDGKRCFHCTIGNLKKLVQP
jgi:hypothetical protein